MMTGPLETLCMRFPWSRAPIERAVAAFGPEATTKVAVELERRGTFSRIEGRAIESIGAAIGEQLLGQEPDVFAERGSVFMPKAAGKPKTAAE